MEVHPAATDSKRVTTSNWKMDENNMENLREREDIGVTYSSFSTDSLCPSPQLTNFYSRRKEAVSAPEQNNNSHLEEEKLILLGKGAEDNNDDDCCDYNVTESCQMRKVVCSKQVRNSPTNSSPNNNKSCRVISRLPETIWRDDQQHHHHHHEYDQQDNRGRHYHHHIINSNCLRTFIISVIVFLLSCTTSITLVHGQPPPLPPAGFLDFDNLPVTRFSCEGKVIGGYYADVETGCQMFHVCTLGQKDEIQDIKFLCLNGTVFDQETRVCERVDEVDCSKAEQFFDLNLDLYVPRATTQKTEEAAADLEEEDDVIRPVATTKPKVTTTTTKATTTTPTTTQSPRTRPPSTSSRSRPAVVSSSSQEEDEDDGNGYTSFNYYLKTPHSHVASGYNSQSRQSYLVNQPGPSIGRSSTGSGSSSSSSTGRKVPSGQKTIVFSSSSTSSSTQRPKTVVVVKTTLPPSKSSLKTKVFHRTTTTTTKPSPPKYELDDQYDEYYDDEDYSDQLPPTPQSTPSTSKQSSYQNQQGVLHSHYANSKPAALVSSSGYDFRDGRSTKGVANAGSIISSTTGKSHAGTGSESKSRQVSVGVSSTTGKQTPTAKQLSTQSIKVISTEFIGNNSTEEPYYYEDDYADDATLQQQQQDQLQNTGFSSSTTKSVKGIVSPAPGRTTIINSKPYKGPTKSVPPQKDTNNNNDKGQQQQQQQQQEQSSASESDYYDDDNDNVNAHDHHFTHVDVPRIPFAKPNVPRVLVTNGKPFLPRLRRQSHHHYYPPPPPSRPPQHRQQTSFHPSGYLLPAAAPGPLRRAHSFQYERYEPLPWHGVGGRSSSSVISPSDLRSEARAKAREWGRDVIR